jgi:hypothetical protein
MQGPDKDEDHREERLNSAEDHALAIRCRSSSGRVILQGLLVHNESEQQVALSRKSAHEQQELRNRTRSGFARHSDVQQHEGMLSKNATDAHTYIAQPVGPYSN